jgi:hypothetical protein
MSGQVKGVDFFRQAGKTQRWDNADHYQANGKVAPYRFAYLYWFQFSNIFLLYV